MSAVEHLARHEALKQGIKLAAVGALGWGLPVMLWEQSIPISLFAWLVWVAICWRAFTLLRVGLGLSGVDSRA